MLDKYFISMANFQSVTVFKICIPIFVLAIVCIQVATTQTLTLYRESYQDGETLELDVENCTESLPSTFLGNIACGNFTVDCAKFYDSENCVGNSVEIRRDKVQSHPPFPLKNIKSIGPCKSLLEEQTKHLNRSFTVELFEQEDFKGHLVPLVLQARTVLICYVLPITIKRKVSSIRMRADDCVVLHADNNCQDAGLRIQINAPTVINLAQWGFNDKTSSISACNLIKDTAANKSQKYEVRTSHNPAPKCPHITLFDEEDFDGNTKHVVVKENCVNFDNDWEGVAESIFLYQKCVIVYNHFNCEQNADIFNDSSAIHSQRLEWTNNTFTGYNLQEFRMDGHIRSVGPCEHRIPPHPFISIYVLAGLFFTGIFVAGCVNIFVRKRDKKERQHRIYHDKPV